MSAAEIKQRIYALFAVFGVVIFYGCHSIRMVIR